MQASTHDREIQDQFTRQAVPFLKLHGQGHDPLLDLMARCAEVRATDTLLDVACGPGIISCYFAPLAAQVTGLDAVPAMLEQARKLQAEKGLVNVEWRQGQSTELPFADESFDRVVTRFSFHHYLDPAAALAEMKRVAKPGGTVLVADVTPRREAQQQFNLWEILRDPSHTRALTVEELRALGAAAGLTLRREESFSLPMDLEGLLARSFPKPGNAERVRALFEEDIIAGQDALGVAARREDGAVKITYPVTVFAWGKP
jgi:ubiquinone/menaquinone biosynthesis C-methylase UbiE